MFFNQSLIKIRESIENLLFEKECPFALYKNCLAQEYICEKCLVNFLDFDRLLYKKLSQLEIYSVCLYKSLPREVIQNLKWQSKKFAAPIAQIMHQFLQNQLTLCRPDLNLESIDYLVPVPGLISKQRDWIPSLEITKTLSRLTKIKLIPDLLLKTQETKFYKLKLKRRISLAKESYTLNPSFKKELKPKPKPRVLLIDDLCASGSTLKACAKILRVNLNQPEIIALTFTRSEL